MTVQTTLVLTVRLRPGADAGFHAWKARHDAHVARFPGFTGSDIIPVSGSDNRAWTILLNFRSAEDLEGWRRSSEHARLLADGAGLFEGSVVDHIEPAAGAGAPQEADVTEVIFSKIKPGMEDAYREWSVRMQGEQAKFPGYRGMFLQPPDQEGGLWTTILRFNSAARLEAWMAAPERARMLHESKTFIEQEQLTRLATAFPGWVPVNPVTGKGPPNWKTAMLVLLGLFPIVMLEMKFLSPALMRLDMHASLATFIANAVSVALTSFLTMPLLVRLFGWWLFSGVNSPKGATLRGNLVIIGLYAAEITALWKLLPW